MSCKKWASLFLAGALLFSAAGCGAGAGETEPGSTASPAAEAADASEWITDRDKEIGYDESGAISITLSGEGIVCNSPLVEVSGSTATITGEGTFLLSGSLTDGQIIVDAEKSDEIQLVLDGVDIHCGTSAAIYVRQADKVFITLAGGSKNSLSNTSAFVDIDENNIDSVIFSKDDLTLNGEGTLTVQAVYGHGIVSKDSLVIASGTYNITAESHAISGKDSVSIGDGTFTLVSGKDGIHGENKDDAALGTVYISGGDFRITSGGDGISASATLQIDSGAFQIQAGGGSGNGESHQETFDLWGGTTEETETASMKGIKAGGDILILGGIFTVDAADDALHSNSNVEVQDGTFTISTGDDGIHGDGNTVISGGTITVTESYEGIEGQTVYISGGKISLLAKDDGLNAAGGTDSSGFGGRFQDGFAGDDGCEIHISGGTVYVNAGGDGIDSNGSLTVSGGEVYVSGPTDSGNGALDYNTEGTISGGIFVAVGASGMAQNFGSTSTQGSILVDFPEMCDGAVTLQDQAGNVLLSFTPEKAYSSVVVSCPEIQTGQTYTLTAGEQSTQVEMTGLLYSSGGMGGGMPGGRGGMSGGKEMSGFPEGDPGGRGGPGGDAMQPEGTPPEDMDTPPGNIGTPPGDTGTLPEGPIGGPGSRA